MKFIVRGRQGGKTNEVIQELFNNANAVLIVLSFAQKRQLQKDWPQVAKQIYCTTDKISGELASTLEKCDVLVDDVDLILRQLVSNIGFRSPNIKAVTATGLVDKRKVVVGGRVEISND